MSTLPTSATPREAPWPLRIPKERHPEIHANANREKITAHAYLVQAVLRVLDADKAANAPAGEASLRHLHSFDAAAGEVSSSHHPPDRYRLWCLWQGPGMTPVVAVGSCKNCGHVQMGVSMITVVLASPGNTFAFTCPHCNTVRSSLTTFG